MANLRESFLARMDAQFLVIYYILFKHALYRLNVKMKTFFPFSILSCCLRPGHVYSVSVHRPLDHMGSPLLNNEGMALFGHGRDSQPVVNPKDKLLTVGGKPLLGLDRPRFRAPIKPQTTTTTVAPTTTPEPTTPEWTTEEITTAVAFPTCPPGTFAKTDEYGYPLTDEEGILDCYPEGESFA